jgi:hypothetical protein
MDWVFAGKTGNGGKVGSCRGIFSARVWVNENATKIIAKCFIFLSFYFLFLEIFESGFELDFMRNFDSLYTENLLINST